jgi:hypothetical protein
MVEHVPVVVGAELVELHVVVVEVILGQTGLYVLQAGLSYMTDGGENLSYNDVTDGWTVGWTVGHVH